MSLKNGRFPLLSIRKTRAERGRAPTSGAFSPRTP
jgi:hypothetical protein